MAMSCAIFALQNASKSAGRGALGGIAVGATAAPSKTRPAPPVLVPPNPAVPAGGRTSTTTIAGSVSDVSILAEPEERLIEPVLSISSPFRLIVYVYAPVGAELIGGTLTVHPMRSPMA
jgi:hypothetical protein